jgi:hypothetical protein
LLDGYVDCQLESAADEIFHRQPAAKWFNALAQPAQALAGIKGLRASTVVQNRESEVAIFGGNADRAPAGLAVPKNVGCPLTDRPGEGGICRLG